MLKGKCVWAGALAIIATVVFGTNTFAESDATDFSITVNPSLSLSVSSANVGFQLTPSKTGSYDSASFNVYSSTNNSTGYTLTMSTSRVNLESDTINPTTGTKPTIPTLTETQDGITAAQFEASTSSDVLNHYGVSIAGSNYNAMKTEKEIKKTSVNNTTEDTTAIALASKLDLLTVPGVYSTTLNFALVANPTDPVQPYPEDPCTNNPDCDATSGVTLQRAYEIAYTNAHKGMYEEDTAGSGTFHYVDSWNGVAYEGNGRDVRFLIQDMTPEICATATAINSQALVLDIRDQSSYYIVKAADGRCWMQDNLALDAVATKNILSPSNTNATQAAINNFITDSGTAPQAGWATEAVTYDSSSPSNEPRIYVESKNVVPQGIDPLASVALAQGWKVGVYYNYCAASIGTYCYASSSGVDTDVTSAIDAKNDICPAGWRMPTGGSYDATARPDGGEYQSLYNDYPDISGGDTQYIRFRKAFRLPLSGIFYISTDLQGRSAYVWSSTFSNNQEMYAFFADNNSAFPQEDYYRSAGRSVRCIAK